MTTKVLKISFGFIIKLFLFQLFIIFNSVKKH